MSKNKTTNKTKQETHPVTGLKVRRSDTVAKVARTPRKMALVAPRRMSEVGESFANSALLVFPTDRLGLTTEVKASLIRAASKVGTDERSLKLLNDTLEILVKHVEARFKENKTGVTLKQRVNTRSPEDAEAALEVDEDEKSYKDMLEALSASSVKPKTRKMEDVAAAYQELTSGTE